MYIGIASKTNCGQVIAQAVFQKNARAISVIWNVL